MAGIDRKAPIDSKAIAAPNLKGPAQRLREARKEYESRAATLVVYTPTTALIVADVVMWVEKNQLHVSAAVARGQAELIPDDARWELYGRDGELAHADSGVVDADWGKDGASWRLTVRLSLGSRAAVSHEQVNAAA